MGCSDNPPTCNQRLAPLMVGANGVSVKISKINASDNAGYCNLYSHSRLIVAATQKPTPPTQTKSNWRVKK